MNGEDASALIGITPEQLHEFVRDTLNDAAGIAMETNRPDLAMFVLIGGLVTRIFKELSLAKTMQARDDFVLTIRGALDICEARSGHEGATVQ